MIREKIIEAISRSLPADEELVFSVERTENPEHGEYASNVALVAAKALKKTPRVLAEELLGKISLALPEEVSKIEVAGPGFINFFLKREYFSSVVRDILAHKQYGHNQSLKGKKVLVEYTDPNPFKEFHIGHLMANSIGESISRLFEAQGAEVKRACYQGDVGLHVAKAIWGMQSVPSRDEKPLDTLSLEAKARYLGHAYQLGAAAYEAGHKEEIETLNRKIYDRSDGEVNKLYEWGRKVSLDYFEKIYERLGTKFDLYFFESEVATVGLEIVSRFLEKGVFEKSDGAIVFRGEKFNPKLHTRVYVTSQGLPTYEAKELALHFAKAEKYPTDLSVVITANEQDTVFEVGLEAFRQIDLSLAQKIKHLSHGMLRLPTGKMSSRKGEVIIAHALLEKVGSLVSEKIKDRGYDTDLKEKIVETVSIGALKYSILHQGIGGDIVFDFEKSISFEGDSGPYLQYAATRAQSLLLKGKAEGIKADITDVSPAVAAFERLLLYFPDVVARAGNDYAPHLIATYLVELAASFNHFYAHEQIVDKSDPHSPYKLALTKAFRIVMENGLALLGIKVPEKM
jgi:arginyl-tRNA synthetase